MARLRRTSSGARTAQPEAADPLRAFEAYTETAALRDGSFAASAAWSRPYYDAHLSRLLPSDREARILELGCGYGRLLHYLADRGYRHATGVDLSEQQVATAHENGVLNAQAGDAEAFLRRARPGFGAIVALDLLEHLDASRLVAIGKLVRQRLSPGAPFIVQVPNAHAPLAPLRHADLTHVRAFTRRSLEQFFLLAGFSADAVEVREVPPHVHGPLSAARRLLWMGVLRPAIGAFALAAYGEPLGGCYTANLLGIARARAA